MMDKSTIGWHHNVELLKALRTGKKCFFPGCNATKQSLINSHTIQRKDSLSSIEEQGHVYRYYVNFKSISDYERYGYFPPNKIGIRKVSVIPAFCNYHDTKLFQVIEDKEIIPTSEQICIFTFRSLTYEIFLKESVKNSTQSTQNFSKNNPMSDFEGLLSQFLYKEETDLLIHGWEIARKELMQDYIKLADKITTQKYEGYSYLLLRCNHILELQCTGYFNPSYDFNGNLIQDLSQESIKTENISVSIFNNSGEGYILITWPREIIYLEQYVVTLLSQKNLCNVIVSMVFCFFENHAFNISWWESLSHIKKRDLCDKIFRAGDLGYDEQKGTHYLSACTHLKYVDWKFSARTNSHIVLHELEKLNFQRF